MHRVPCIAGLVEAYDSERPKPGSDLSVLTTHLLPLSLTENTNIV